MSADFALTVFAVRFVILSAGETYYRQFGFRVDGSYRSSLVHVHNILIEYDIFVDRIPGTDRHLADPVERQERPGSKIDLWKTDRGSCRLSGATGANYSDPLDRESAVYTCLASFLRLFPDPRDDSDL
ncbi:hypothetical protein SISNIDRAFT_464773 [Sistotremastrum niveocremeum HHB9708]|uniref:Fungal-type protein kinase domain-containing protein n=1 Tax=Sistotremastrum niveocremeum HHB9708 TaxID=1314777 RepID=A0A164WJZ7_9AGAM|nr:hypothetical protein SISNIDRAFT_464773 [Sistotremastrum niveocremeum HHB9708]